jgi:hypothetical protein
MLDREESMDRKTRNDDPDVSAIRQLMKQELSLSWSREKDGDWERFTNTFLAGAALFPASRPAKPQTLDQFVERLKQLRAEGTLGAFEVSPLGCEVHVFGNVAVAFAACGLLENETSSGHEINATLLVREAGGWRIAAQAWDVETDTRRVPAHLLKPG